MDYDDGNATYDVEFYSGNMEYDYKIDKISGIILEYDRDIEYYSIQSTSSNQVSKLQEQVAPPATSNITGQHIGETKAKAIALTHAGVSESQVVLIKVHLNYDDGRAAYDVEFYSGNMEYDYKIDKISGTILEYDRDIEYYSIQSTSSNQVSKLQEQVTSPATSNTTGQHIGEAKAKPIALHLHMQEYRKLRLVR